MFKKCVIGLLLVSLCSATASAYTSESPEVKTILNKAAKFLEQDDKAHQYLGGDCLVALALYKAGKPPSHKLIKRVLQRCKTSITGDLSLGNVGVGHSPIYSYALTLIFLCEVSPTAHKAQIDILVDRLISAQTPNGAWGYAGEDLGDTSQTQYVVLALWEAKRAAQAKVPDDIFINCLKWLIRTQDPTGAWGYKGEDPGVDDGTRIKQHKLSHSITGAGLSTIYVCADALGIENVSKPDAGERVTQSGDVPPALVFVKLIGADGEDVVAPSPVDRNAISRAMLDGNRWFRLNHSVNPRGGDKPWPHYFRYTYERYQSFRELAEKRDVKEPAWYNSFVNFLAGDQNKTTGSFGGLSRPGVGAKVYTSFAILLLARSTKKTIGKLVEGQLKGNQGLNKSTGELRLSKTGRIATESVTKNVGDLLALLDDDVSEAEFDKLFQEQLDVALTGDSKTKREQAAKIRALVTHKKYSARMLAVRTIARNRDLDNVPALIFSLSDPDGRVVRTARDGLRFISRKFDGFKLADDVEPQSADIQRAQDKWKEWYKSIRPEAEFDSF